MTIYRGLGTTSNGMPIEDYLTSKVERSGDTMTGPLNVPAGAAGTQVPQKGEIDTALALKANLISPILVTPNIGTPSSGVLTNCTGIAAGLTAGTVTTNANLTGHITSVGNTTSLGSFTSAQLATAITDETGSGSAVFATSPTLVTPAIGTPSSGVLTNCTGTATGLSIGGNAATATTATTATTAGFAPEAQTITVTMNANAATIAALNSIPLEFRSATATSGATTTVTAPSANLVIPDTATLGSTSAVAATYVVIEVNDSGTRYFAVSNKSGGLQCDEKNLVSTTAITTGADSANVWYSTAGHTSCPYRVVGEFTATEATAGTWATAASSIQPIFGEAVVGIRSTVRVHTSNGYGSTNTTIQRYTTIQTNIGSDITYADSATLGASFTINTDGVYTIANVFNPSSIGYGGISLNSTQLTTAIYNINTADILGACYVAATGFETTTTCLFLPAGSIIRPHSDGVANTKSSFTISRVD